MHVAFRSEEIRSIVFEELPRASLASLAATCQDFHESALRILWRECGSLQLDHFAKLLPKTTCIYIVYKYVGESPHKTPCTHRGIYSALFGDQKPRI